MMPLTDGLIMLTRPRRLLGWLAQDTWQHAARTALAAGGSLAVARFLGLPEAYWAPITAILGALCAQDLRPRERFSSQQ